MSDRPSLLVTRALIPGVMEALRERFEVDVYDGDGAIPREDLVRVTDEKMEQLHFPRGQRDGLLPAPQLKDLGIQRTVA